MKKEKLREMSEKLARKVWSRLGYGLKPDNISTTFSSYEDRSYVAKIL